MKRVALIGMLALHLGWPMAASGDDSELFASLVAPEELQRLYLDAAQVIRSCREGTDCDGKEGRERLARAFLVQTVHASVFDGRNDELSAASASFLDPELAIAWGIAEPEGVDPLAWVSFRFGGKDDGFEEDDVEVPLGRDWEKTTWHVGLGWIVSSCEEFTTIGGESAVYNGNACEGQVSGQTALTIRPGGVLMLAPFLAMGDSYITDMDLVHQLDDSVSSKVPFHAFDSGLGVLVGVALPAPGGEIRLGAGPRLGLNRVSQQTLDTLGGYELVLDFEGSLSLGLRLGVGVEGKLGRALRIGPRLTVDVGNEVSLFWTDGFNETQREISELRNRDTEMAFRPSLALSLPAMGPAALHVEAGAAITINYLYSQAVKDDLEQVNTPVDAVSVLAPLWVEAGVDFRF